MVATTFASVPSATRNSGTALTDPPTPWGQDLGATMTAVGICSFTGTLSATGAADDAEAAGVGGGGGGGVEISAATTESTDTESGADCKAAATVRTFRGVPRLRVWLASGTAASASACCRRCCLIPPVTSAYASSFAYS